MTSTHSVAWSSAPASRSTRTSSIRPSKVTLLRWKRMFQAYVLSISFFQRYDTRVSHGCCKSRLWCCICCNGYTLMLQTSLPNVSSVFSNICFKCVLSRCCICFTHTPYVASVSFGCCYVFQWLQTSFFRCFARMLQVFSTDVTKVDMVLHTLHWDPSAAATCCNCWVLLQCGRGTRSGVGHGTGVGHDAAPAPMWRVEMAD
jgi:hypothetical protein